MIVAQGASTGDNARINVKAPEVRHSMSPLRGLLIYSMLIPMTYVMGY